MCSAFTLRNLSKSKHANKLVLPCANNLQKATTVLYKYIHGHEYCCKSASASEKQEKKKPILKL